MSEWRPIETAPKDGTWILLARAGDDIGCEPYELARWHLSYYAAHYEPAGDGLFRRVEKPIFGWMGASNAHRATHWMPLPERPEAQP